MGDSSGLDIILAGAWVFYLGMLALLLTLPCDSNVGATTNFGLSGFQENSLHSVLDSSWVLDITTGCFYLDPPHASSWYSYPGRILFPGAVQMRDPGATTVKSFSTSFIYQLRIVSSDGYTGPGLAFLIVPDNFTIGAPFDFMGLITNRTSDIEKYYESDNHTLGVELDTFKNPEFNDPNNNHIGINLASMNSTFTIIPVYSLAATSADLYQQIWIDYFEADSRMDIYYAHYKQGKPAKPQGSKSGLNLSLLNEKMYIGFSSARGGNFPYVCAWSFSNDGNPAPPIVLAQDATPGAPPPPAAVTPPPPPAPATPPAPSPPDGPVAAPSVPPPATLPSPPPRPPRSPSPAISSPPPLTASNPPPSSSPNPPTPSSIPPHLGPINEPPTIAEKGGKKKDLTGVIAGVCVGVLVPLVLVGLCIFVLRCRRRFLSHPQIRIFISHAGGPDGSEKNFAISLHDRLKEYRWSTSNQSNITLFIDKENIEDGEIFAAKILAELARFDVGLVVVTHAFFNGKWPMTELIAFLEPQMKDPTDTSVRVIPLFYKLTPDEVRDHLEAKTWEPVWEEWSTGNHSLDVKTCRTAVTLLCGRKGILYRSKIRDYDKEYIEEICRRLNKTLFKERNFPAFLWEAINTSYRVPSNCRPRTGIPEREMVTL